MTFINQMYLSYIAMFILYCCGCDIDMKFRPRMFPPTDLGVWQIGIRAIDYSELVISSKRKITKYSF